MDLRNIFKYKVRLSECRDTRTLGTSKNLFLFQTADTYEIFLYKVLRNIK